MFVLVLSFCDLYLSGKVMRTDDRDRYCGQYCFPTVVRWIGMGWGREVIIGRASSISLETT